MLLPAGMPPDLYAQGGVTERPELRNWSIQVFGGTAMARSGSRFSPFTGATGEQTDPWNLVFGAGIEYMATPSFSVHMQYRYAALENDAGQAAFGNTYQSLSGGVSLYVLNLTPLDRSNARFHPYISLAGGYGRSEWSGLDGLGDSDDDHAHYGFGAGTRIRLSSMLELSLDYTYQIFDHSHAIDGYPGVDGPFASDRLAGFTAGLVFKPGRSSHPHARWYVPARDIHAWRASVDEALAANRDEWGRIIVELEEQDDRLDELTRDMSRKASQRDLSEVRLTIGMLDTQLDRMGALLEDMGSQLDEMGTGLGGDIQRIDRIHHAAGIAYMTPTLEPGIYIQTFAAVNVARAHRALEMTRDGLAELGYDTDRLAFYVHQPSGGLYTVQIGNLPDMDQADVVLTKVLDIFDDAFVYRLESDR